MKHGIREFRPRQPLDRQLSSDTLNRILRELESLRITQVVNGSVRKLPSGTEIVVAPQRGGGSESSHPFQIIATPNAQSPAQVDVTMTPGTINGILAGNWSATRTMTKNATHYIVLTVTTDGQAVLSTSWAEQATSPNADEPKKWTLSTSLKVLIGIVANGVVKQLIKKNLTANGKKRLTTEKNNATLGQIPYDNWYVWDVT